MLMDAAPSGSGLAEESWAASFLELPNMKLVSKTLHTALQRPRIYLAR